MNERCEICYQKIGENDQRFFCNNCAQDYHKSCIGTSTANSNQCPMCKSPFFEGRESLSQNVIANPSRNNELKISENMRDSNRGQLETTVFVNNWRSLPPVEKGITVMTLILFVLGIALRNPFLLLFGILGGITSFLIAFATDPGLEGG